MNTIPITFNKKITSYTAVGGKERVSSSGITAVVLNRPGYSRGHFFQELEKSGFENVISVESPSPHYDIEELSGRFPFVRFMLPKTEITLGEQINIAASEIDSPLFFVLSSDVKIIAGGTARRMAERLSVNETNGDKNTGFKRLCTVPIIVNPYYEFLPTLTAPVTRKRKMRTAILEPHAEGQLSLYPFNGIGIYDRRRFIEIGGFDVTINNTYWQLLDFGFRASLWGEEIALSLQLKLLCEGKFNAEAYTIDENYRRFFLKNLAPVFYDDYAHLPLYRFPSYLLRSGEDIISAWHDFSKSREWIKTNKYRWRCDVRAVAGKWNNAAASEPFRKTKMMTNIDEIEQEQIPS